MIRKHRISGLRFYRGTQGYTGVHRGTQGYTGVHRGSHGYTGVQSDGIHSQDSRK